MKLASSLYTQICVPKLVSLKKFEKSPNARISRRPRTSTTEPPMTCHPSHPQAWYLYLFAPRKSISGRGTPASCQLAAGDHRPGTAAQDPLARSQSAVAHWSSDSREGESLAVVAEARPAVVACYGFGAWGARPTTRLQFYPFLQHCGIGRALVHVP